MSKIINDIFYLCSWSLGIIIIIKKNIDIVDESYINFIL